MHYCHGVKENAKINVPLVKQNVMKLEVFILGGQRIDQKRNKGGRRERIYIVERKETKGN